MQSDGNLNKVVGARIINLNKKEIEQQIQKITDSF